MLRKVALCFCLLAFCICGALASPSFSIEEKVSSSFSIEENILAARKLLIGKKRPLEAALGLLQALWEKQDEEHRDHRHAYAVANSMVQSALLCCSYPDDNMDHCSLEEGTAGHDCMFRLISADVQRSRRLDVWPVSCLQGNEKQGQGMYRFFAASFSPWWYWVSSWLEGWLLEDGVQFEESENREVNQTILSPTYDQQQGFLVVSGSLAAFGSVTGLNNQLMATMKLLTASRLLNRTALVPPFMLHKRHTWHNFAVNDETDLSNWQVSPFSSLFNVSYLQSEAGYNFVVCQSHDCSDILGLEPGDYSTGVLIPLLNEAHPAQVWNPPYEFLNQAVLDKDGPLVRRLKLERAKALQLTPLELFWLGVSWDQSNTFFAALRPHSALDKQAMSFVQGLLNPGRKNSTSALEDRACYSLDSQEEMVAANQDDSSVPMYIGVHTRFDSHCQKRMRTLASKIPPKVYLPYIASCTKTTATVDALLAQIDLRRESNESTCLRVFLAKGPGGNSYDLLDRGAVLHQTSHEKGVFRPNFVEEVLLDMIILFHSKYFIPTPVSTLSGVVSAWRNAHGKSPSVIVGIDPLGGLVGKARIPSILQATNGWFPYVVPELWLCGIDVIAPGRVCQKNVPLEFVFDGWRPDMDGIQDEDDKKKLSL